MKLQIKQNQPMVINDQALVDSIRPRDEEDAQSFLLYDFGLDKFMRACATYGSHKKYAAFSQRLLSLFQPLIDFHNLRVSYEAVRRLAESFLTTANHKSSGAFDPRTFTFFYGMATLLPTPDCYDYPDERSLRMLPAWLRNFALLEAFPAFQQQCMELRRAGRVPDKFFRDSVHHQFRVGWLMELLFSQYGYCDSCEIFEAHYRKFFRSRTSLILKDLLAYKVRHSLDDLVHSFETKVRFAGPGSGLEYCFTQHAGSRWHRLLLESGIYHDMGMLVTLDKHLAPVSSRFPHVRQIVDRLNNNLKNWGWVRKQILSLSRWEPIVVSDRFLSGDADALFLECADYGIPRPPLSSLRRSWQTHVTRKGEMSQFFDSELYSTLCDDYARAVRSDSIKDGHGLIGALLMQNLPIEVRQAIAIHQPASFAVKFDMYPLAFCLILADELQDWNRSYVEADHYKASPGDMRVTCDWDNLGRSELCRWKITVAIDCSHILKSGDFYEVGKAKYQNLKRLVPVQQGDGTVFPMIEVKLSGVNGHQIIVATSSNGDWELHQLQVA